MPMKRNVARPLLVLSIVHVVLIVAISLLLSVPSAFGQATTGAISGVVTDTSGAMVAGAEVTATAVATGWQSTEKTNTDGIYFFPRLKSGAYRVTFVKQGFKKDEFNLVTVTLAQTTTLNSKLEVGTVQETVTVTAGGELLQAEESQISGTLEAKAVEDLPSNPAGTGIDALAFLTPGVSPTYGSSSANGANLSVNGNRGRANNFTIDGGDNNDLTNAGPMTMVDNADMVAQFQILTGNFSAEYGRNQGAVVNITTKSGSNEYHGTSAFFYRSASWLNALSGFQKENELLTSPPSSIYKLWSGTFGGPVIKDKLFFFGSFQDRQQPSTLLFAPFNPTFTPDQLTLLAANNPGNDAIQLVAKYSLFALPGLNVKTNTQLPASTITIGGVPYNVVYPQFAIDNGSSEIEPSGRVDYRINDKHSLWFRELYEKQTNTNIAANASGWLGNATNHSRLTTASWNWQVSNTAFNEFRFVFNRLDRLDGGGCSGINCTPSPANFGQTFTRLNFLGVTNTLGSNLLDIGATPGSTFGQTASVYQFADNFSKVIGRHQMKFGADIHRSTNELTFLKDGNGLFLFTDPSQLITNAPIEVLLTIGNPTIDYNETDTYLYFQDNWKVKNNLTLNLGIRWEYSGQPLNNLHDLSLARESNPSTALWLQSLPLSQRTFPSYASDKHNFAPRLGFSWSPRDPGNGILHAILGDSEHTIISGGYAISYEPAVYEMMLLASQGAPFILSNTTINYPGQSATFPIPAVDATGSVVQAFAKNAGILQVNTFDPTFLNQTAPEQGFHNPYSHQWNLRWQREFGRNQVAEVRYVGNRGIGLFATGNGNPYVQNLVNGFSLVDAFDGQTYTFPGFGTKLTNGAVPLSCPPTPTDPTGACDGRVLPQGLVESYGNGASSTYNGLQTRYQGRIKNQLTLSANYTFSKALDDASEIDAIQSSPAAADPFNRKYDKSYADFDRRHVFAMYFSWDIPTYKAGQGLLGKVAGGWQVNGIWNWASGDRYSPISYFNSDYLSQIYPGAGYVDPVWDNSFPGYDSVRPFVANLKAPSDQVAINSIDASLVGYSLPAGLSPAPNVFLSLNQLNQSGTSTVVNLNQVRYVVNGPGAVEYFGNPFGTVARNIAQGPTLNNWNVSLFKNTNLTERVKLQLRLETFNAFNHPNPGVGVGQAQTAPPNPFIESAGSPGGFGQASQEVMQYSARVVQLGVKILF